MWKFQTYFVDNLKNRYAKFDGRANRREYWYFVLFYFLISSIAGLIDATIINPMLLGQTPMESARGGMLQMIVTLGLMIPSIAIGIRRLHDIGKKGWWILLGFVPFVGIFILIYFYVQDSHSGENIYGPSSK